MLAHAPTTPVKGGELEHKQVDGSVWELELSSHFDIDTSQLFEVFIPKPEAGKRRMEPSDTSPWSETSHFGDSWQFLASQTHCRAEYTAIKEANAEEIRSDWKRGIQGIRREEGDVSQLPYGQTIFTTSTLLADTVRTSMLNKTLTKYAALAALNIATYKTER
ncbi:hypothetical protein EI94DRAFT_1786328 [Lactarius quietus]|nr:hypothetical protein EI94DRAFT_1786328 [Lactarius quietus]